MGKQLPEARRYRLLRKKLRTEPRYVLEDMLAEVYMSIWCLSDRDYPDGEVSGADVIDAIAKTFADRKISPKEIP